jgi:hypothetical protein
MSQVPNPYSTLVDEVRYNEVVNAEYVKSSFSVANGGCLSFAQVGELIGFQDDKLPVDERKARTLVFTREEMRAYVLGAKAGDFDHLI